MEYKTVPLLDDSFIHFTYESRAIEILKDFKLLIDPPYKKFGIDGVQAVSVNYGSFVPGVQLNHLKSGSSETIVAIWFTTRVLPKYGYPEEVIWDRDVPFIKASILSTEEAINKLNKRDSEDDEMFIYESLLCRLQSENGI
jgi:hypothetical protein